MKRRMTRRDFFARLGRAAGVVGLGALVGRLVGRRPGPPRRGEELCRHCPVLARCNFPEAARLRRSPAVSATTPDHVRGLCGARPTDAPGSRWTMRETT